MASGDTLFVLTPRGSTPPATLFATLDTILDASTPNMVISVLDFRGDTGDEHADWFATIPSQYSGATGFTWSYKYAMDGADVDNVQMELRILHLDDLDILTADLGMDGQSPNTVSDTPAGTANKLNYTSTDNIPKANFGSAGPGDRLCIRASRNFDFGTNTDDLQLVEILITET